MTEPSSNPLVSICIPAYNRASMIGDAIRSALDQTYSPIEVIVVDNASSDRIEEVVDAFGDPRLKFVKNRKNLGLFGNFNRCIELSQGKYLHILHSDDYIDPGFTRTCVEFLESHPEVGMTFTDILAISEQAENRIGHTSCDNIFPAPEGFRQILRFRNLISCPSVMVRRDVYDSVGPFSLEYPYSGDLYQWLRIARRFAIVHVTGATLYYRQGKHSESFELLFRTPLGYVDQIRIFIRIIDELGDDAPHYRQDLNIAIRRHMKDCLFAGIARSDRMKSFSPLVFTGLAFNAWGLILSESLWDRIRKFSDFLAIVAIAGIMFIPGGRSLALMVFQADREQY